MKTMLSRLLIVATILIAFGQPLRSFAADEARATVNFENPDQFTDIKDSIASTDNGRGYYLKEFRKLVEEEAAHLLPAGQKLVLTFSDIDLAGDYLPSMASNQNIRVMKDIYRPRMEFSYQITDAAGAVVKEGKEAISDMNYLQTVAVVGRSDNLFYDKALLRDWLRRELKP